MSLAQLSPSLFCIFVKKKRIFSLFMKDFLGSQFPKRSRILEGVIIIIIFVVSKMICQKNS